MIKSTALLLVVSAVAGLSSYYATVATQSSTQPATQPTTGPAHGETVADWLSLDTKHAEQVVAADPRFADESRTLTASLTTERQKLAALLEDPSSRDEQIRDQVKRTIAAHDALELRVMDHLLAVRPHLTAAEQKRLLGLCAQGVREAAGWRWRGGRGPGAGPAGGGRRGGGPGRGRGPRWLRDGPTDVTPDSDR